MIDTNNASWGPDASTPQPYGPRPSYFKCMSNMTPKFLTRASKLGVGTAKYTDVHPVAKVHLGRTAEHSREANPSCLWHTPGAEATVRQLLTSRLIPTATFCRMLGSQLPIKLGVLSCLLSAPADTKGGATTAGRQGIQLGQRGRGTTNNASSIIFCAFMSAPSW